MSGLTHPPLRPLSGVSCRQNPIMELQIVNPGDHGTRAGVDFLLHHFWGFLTRR